jgi:hypothetical protein
MSLQPIKPPSQADTASLAELCASLSAHQADRPAMTPQALLGFVIEAMLLRVLLAFGHLFQAWRDRTLAAPQAPALIVPHSPAPIARSTPAPAITPANTPWRPSCARRRRTPPPMPAPLRVQRRIAAHSHPAATPLAITRPTLPHARTATPPRLRRQKIQNHPRLKNRNHISFVATS